MKQRVGNLARHHIGFVAVGQRDDHIGVRGTRTLQHLRVGGVTDYRANIEAILQVAQDLGILVNNSDLVGFLSGKAVRRGRPHLTCTENEDVHVRLCLCSWRVVYITSRLA